MNYGGHFEDKDGNVFYPDINIKTINNLTINTEYVYSSDFEYHCYRVGNIVILHINTVAFISEMGNDEELIYGLPKPKKYTIFHLYGGLNTKGTTARVAVNLNGNIQIHHGKPSCFGNSANIQYSGIVIYECVE